MSVIIQRLCRLLVYH